MNNLTKLKPLFQLLIILAIIFLITLGYIVWGRYLNNHFLGSFDQYGSPSSVFETGWQIMTHAWPLWVIPTLFFLAIIELIEFLVRDYTNSQKEEEQKSTEQQTKKIEKVKEKSQMDFTRALEIEELKQQVDILKHKYFEEHQKAQESSRNIEEMSIALEAARKAAAAVPPPPPAEPRKTTAPVATNAHNEVVISSLKAENKKLLKQVAELQEDLEQSNALIEKLLETQGS